MKTITLLFIILIFNCLQNYSQVTNLEVDAPLSSVTVFLNGAEVTQSKEIKLSAGRNLVLFKGISPNLDPQSIRMSTNPDISVLSVTSNINYLVNPQVQPKIKTLKDSLDNLKKKLSDFKDLHDALKVEKEMLLKNEYIGGQNTGVLITELLKAADFYRNRIKEINNKISEINKNIELLQPNLTGLQAQLNELNAKFNDKRYEISILLNSKVASNAVLELKYLVSDAGWAPIYDIKAAEINQPIDLIYRAKVFNNTGIAWEKIKLILSTGDPNLSAVMPEQKPWYLNTGYSQQFEYGKGYQQNIMQNNMQFDQNMVQQKMMDNVGAGESFSSITTTDTYKEVDLSDLSTDFEIQGDYSIPADNKPYMVDVATHQLPAKFRYASIPKLDKGCFLLASVAGWQGLDLVEGSANIFLNGTFMGQSYIQTRNVKDTLDLSLGRDNKVLVTRTKQKKFSSSKIIGSKQKDAVAYEIIVKNNRKNPIEVQIIDQIPISQNSEIEVEKVDVSGAKVNDVSGELKWDITLQPGQSQKLLNSYTVKYPKNTVINLEQTRKRSMKKM